MAEQTLLERPTIDAESMDEITASPSPSPAHEQPDSLMHDKSRDEHPQETRPATEHLNRQGYIVYLVLFYAAMLCTSWSILVVTSKRPVGRSTYGCFDRNNYCSASSEDLVHQNTQTTRYISNAQTLLSAVSLLTIPLTSTVCAAAVVPWLQQNGQGMSLRQIMTLSDKGWTSPYVYYRLLRPDGWKRYGSSFIALALLLHALGAALSPAISQMSTLIAVKVPRSSPEVPSVWIMRLEDLFQDHESQELTIFTLRDLLKTVNPFKVLPRIWVPETTDCETEERVWPGSATQCTDRGMTYLSLPAEPEAWISQLSSGFATGVKPSQYIPRINTSVEVELINELPAECNPVHASLWISYAGASSEGDERIYDWSVKVCIPESNAYAFEDTDNAQNLVETAYLDLYTYNLGENPGPYHNISKITMTTTIGYFELPNYNNLNFPGPLLRNYTTWTRPTKSRQRRQPDLVFSLVKNDTEEQPYMETLPRKGPLVNIIFALFGNGSMPSIYLNENATYNPGKPGDGRDAPCIDIVPLSTLVEAYSPNDTSSWEYQDKCLTYWDLIIGDQMHLFLRNFFIPTQALERVFTAAAYMSHEIWLGSAVDGLRVDYDAGQDLQKPGLTDRSIIALTIAIAVFLLSLLMLAFYASFSKTWTYSLDAHALLRIGAELGSEALPFLVIQDAHHIGELDELPGWVGDVTEGDDVRERQLGMGWNGLVARQVKPVNKDYRYISYPKMRHRSFLQVFCLWCDTIFGLGGLRRTRAGVKVQKVVAWSRESSRGLVQPIVQKFRTWVRHTKLGKWWCGDHLVYPGFKDESPEYKRVGQDSIA